MSNRLLNYSRIYSDDEGSSHFSDEEIKLSGWEQDDAFMMQTIFQDAERISFGQCSKEIDMGWHPAPERRFIIVIQGSIHVEVGDAEKRSFSAGKILFLEDTSGQGHKTETGEHGCLLAFVSIPNDPVALFEQKIIPITYSHDGSPKFKFRYPDKSELLEPDTALGQVVKMNLPDSAVVDTAVTDIQSGIELSDVVRQIIVPVIKGFGSKVEVVSNHEIEIDSGERAFKSHIRWLYSDTLPMATLSVSVFSDEKLVCLSASTYKDPEEVAWIVESLRLD